MGRIGLYLSGGGTNGAYQVGILKAMRECNIRVDHIVGHSTGAINAALYSMGENGISIGEKIYNNFNEKDFQKGNPYWRVIRGKSSLKESDPLFNMLQKYIRPSQFKIPFSVGVVEIADGLPYYLIPYKDSEILRYIWASTAIPIQWEPVVVRDKRYWDGGFETPIGKLIDGHMDKIIIMSLTDRDKIIHPKAGNIPRIAQTVVDKFMLDNSIADIQMFEMVNAFMAVPGNKPPKGKDYRYIPSVTIPLPETSLGSGLDFDPQKAKDNLVLGYVEGLKFFDNLDNSWKNE